MFNGEYARVEVFQHDSESGISCPVDQLITTEVSNTLKSSIPPCVGSSVCGNTSTDDLARIPSTHPAVAHHWGGPLATDPDYAGLITEGGGTVWLTSNGTFASAGHVISGTTQLFRQVHFNVPSSSEDGALVVPSPDHQYAIDYSSIARSYNEGNGDWAVFKVFPNPNTGLLPHEVQNSFLRVGKDNIPSLGYKYGYGIDLFPSGTCGGTNSSNRTLQKAPADNVLLSSSTTSGLLTWLGVVEGGDSGGPVVTTINSVEIAVGSNNYCSGNSSDDGAGGTSFVNANFANALNNINGTTVKYIDSQHPSLNDEGTILRPYKTIVDGINGASNSETLSIVKGYYNETMTISKPLTLTAPVGKVTIGGSGSSSKAIAYGGSIIAENKEVTNTPLKFELSQNYPNPFNPSTVIDYSIPERANVTLTIYNVLGQEIVTLVNEIKQPGIYSAKFDASQFSSGVYFYLLKAGNKELFNQMTLIK